MSRRFSGVGIAGLLLGLVVIGSTLFAAVSIFGGGPLAMQWPGRQGNVAERITEEIGRGIRQGARSVRPGAALLGSWKSAEGEESVAGSQTALTVTNVSGPIRVAGWDGETVRVRYVKQARTDADLQDFRIEVRSDAETVTVRPVYEPAGGIGRFGSVDFEVSVPRRIARVTLHDVSGPIVVDELPGVVMKELSTVSGAITSSGDGDLTAKTTSGAVAFDFSGDELEASTVSGRIEGTVRSLGPKGADIRTVSGRVSLDAPPALNAELDLRSVSGSITCDFPVTIREQTRNRLKGTVGSGGIPVSVSTTSGSIRIGKK